MLGYAGAAAAADLVPAVGLIAVPSVQGKMLHALAGRYGVPWDRRTAKEFLTVLGSSFLYRYALSLSGRQLVKLVPVYGQTAGAAAAASISFASTYALGRAACLYLFRRVAGEPVATEDLREAFRRAFDETRDAGRETVDEATNEAAEKAVEKAADGAAEGAAGSGPRRTPPCDARTGATAREDVGQADADGRRPSPHPVSAGRRSGRSGT